MDILSKKELETHVTVVGWLQIADGVITLLAAAFVVAVLLTVGDIAGDPVAYRFLATIGWLTGGLLLILALPGLVAGIGLLYRENWARMMALVVAVFQLVLFPTGTLLGGYTLFVLSQRAAPEVFGACCALEESRLQAAGA